MLPKDKSELVHLVVVANGSNRPIREVACKIEVLVLIIAKLRVCSVPRTAQRRCVSTEALGVGPVDVGAGDAVERGDGVPRTPAGRGTLAAGSPRMRGRLAGR